MNKLTILSFLLLLFFDKAFTQTIQNGETSEALSQPKVVVFTSGGDSENGNKKNTLNYRHMFKINPLMYFKGDFPVLYEFRFAKDFSSELGIGFTHKDYVYEVFETRYSYDPNPEYSTGASYRLGLKYWPSKYGALEEGFYFSLEYLYRKYNSMEFHFIYVGNSNDYYIDNEYLDLEIATERIQKQTSLVVGYVYYLDDYVFFEWYTGIGFQNNEKKGLHYDRNDDYTIGTKKESKPTYLLGIKIGFSF